MTKELFFTLSDRMISIQMEVIEWGSVSHVS